MLESLKNKPLIFVTGKGGVGKSVASGAIARTLARDGKKILVVETDTYSVFDTNRETSTTEIKRTKIEDNVWAVNLRSDVCLVETLTRYLPSRRIVRTILGNRVTKAFFDSAPSVNEFVLLDQIIVQASTASDFDTVLVDLPASGHAITFLTVPKTLYGMMRGIGPIAKRADEIHQIICDESHTAMVAVCLPEEMPVNETIELGEAIEEKLGRPLDVIVANMVHQSPVVETEVNALQNAVKQLNGSDSAVAEVIRANGLAAEWFIRDTHYLKVLEESTDAPIVRVPMMYENDRRVLLDAVTDHVASWSS